MNERELDVNVTDDETVMITFDSWGEDTWFLDSADQLDELWVARGEEA